VRGKLVLLVGWCGRVAALAIATAVLAVANPSSEGRAAAFHATGQRPPWPVQVGVGAESGPPTRPLVSVHQQRLRTAGRLEVRT
jgi:hypothetical protein